MSELHFGKRLRQFFWKPDPDSEIREEVDHHVELIVRELMATGMDRTEAEAQARQRFGTRGAVEDHCREIATRRNRRQEWTAWLADLKDDLRYGGRSLRNNPGFTATAGITLAVAIAANALVFALVNSVLLRQLPYESADRLVVVEELTGQGGAPWELSAPTLEDIRQSGTRFESITGWLETEVNLQGEETLRISAALVDSEFFPTLGTLPFLGQPLSEMEFGTTSSVVLSHRLWIGRFGGDSSILGQSIGLNSQQFTVVGIMPPSFAIPSQDTRVWLEGGRPEEWMMNRAVHIFRTVARLKPGITSEIAAGELGDLTRRIQQDHAGEDPGHTVTLRPLHTAITGDVRPTLTVLFGAVLVMVILACTNMTGLTLTRVRARDGEFAVRAALGASRGRLIRQLLVEGLLLALLGAVAGLAVAWFGLRQAIAMLPPGLPRIQEIHLDGRVLAFTLLVATGCGLVLGLLPAFHAGRLDLRTRLIPTGKGAIGGSNRLAQGGLVVVQIALSLILVTGAALLVRSFKALQAVDPGFADREELVTFRLSLPSSRYDRPRIVEFYQELPRRLGSIPGVSSVSAASELPVSGGDGVGGLTIENREMPEGDEASATYRRVIPNYFKTMGIPLLRGREFTDQDAGSPAMVVIISAGMARRFWPDQDPVGQRIKIGPPEGEPWLTVVGVVGDVHNVALEASPQYDTYEPHAQRPRGTMSVVLRATGDPDQIGGTARSLLRELDSDLPIWDITTMSDRIEKSLAPRRFNAVVITAFGMVALGLALLGVYGITANGVARRRREFGIRIALGAAPVSIRNMVVRQGLILAVVGVALGLPVAWWLSRNLQDLLFSISATDPTAYSMASILLAGTALVASWIPALRATRVSPMTALREE